MSNSRDEALKQKFRLTKYPYYQGITLHVKNLLKVSMIIDLLSDMYTFK